MGQRTIIDEKRAERPADSDAALPNVVHLVRVPPRYDDDE